MSFLGGFAPGNGGLSRIAALEAQVGDSGIQFLAGEDDPSAGAGIAATAPAFYARVVGDVGTMYFKEGAADTAWVRVVSQVFDALLTSTRFKASAAGSNTLPAYALPDENGIYQEATGTTSITGGALRKIRVTNAAVDILNAPLTTAQTVTIGQYLIAAAAQTTNLAELTPFKTNNLSLGAVAILRITTSDANQILTSITGGANGRDLVIVNANAVGGDPFTVQYDNGADGTAANRFAHAGGLNNIIDAGGASVYRYTSASRWNLLLP